MDSNGISFAPKMHSGIDLVDKYWGGMYRGGSYLIFGRASSGRGLLTLVHTKVGVLHEETCLFLSPSRPKDLMIQAASVGFNLRHAYETGAVKLLRIPPMLNLSEKGDDGVEKALKDLVKLIRQHQPVRLIIDDFTPFMQFRSFDRLRAAFIDMLEQIDSLETTLLIAVAEPANQQSRKIVEFISKQMTGSVHIEVAEEDDAASTNRRISLLPNIGHVRSKVVEYWDLATILVPEKELEPSNRMLPAPKEEAIKDKGRMLPPPKPQRERAPMLPPKPEPVHAPEPPKPVAQPQMNHRPLGRPAQAPAPAPRRVGGGGLRIGGSPQRNAQPMGGANRFGGAIRLGRASNQGGMRLGGAPREIVRQPQAMPMRPAPAAPRPYHQAPPAQHVAVPQPQAMPAYVAQHVQAPGHPEAMPPVVAQPEVAPAPMPSPNGLGVPPMPPSLQTPMPPQVALPPQAPSRDVALPPSNLVEAPMPPSYQVKAPAVAPSVQGSGLAVPPMVQAPGSITAPPAPVPPPSMRHMPATPPAQPPSMSLRMRQVPPAPTPNAGGMPPMAVPEGPLSAAVAMQPVAPPPVPASSGTPVSMPSQGPASTTHTDRDGFRMRLQQHFHRRDISGTPFLAIAMRMDRSDGRTARPFDFEFILDLITGALRGQDDVFVDLERERLIVLLAESRPEEAQHFFTRLKNKLREEAPQQADHLLHSVSAIVVPDGRPFQNAEEFLTYALDEG